MLAMSSDSCKWLQGAGSFLKGKNRFHRYSSFMETDGVLPCAQDTPLDAEPPFFLKRIYCTGK
jgi:hypothetical protein